MLFACIFFISVSGSDIVEDNNLSLTFKTFFSGDYTQALEDSYNNSIPFPDAMKAVEERISLIYGIGNKVTDPIKETPDNTDSNHNSFDHPTNNDSDDPDENVITTTAKPQDGEVTTTKKKEDKKKQQLPLLLTDQRKLKAPQRLQRLPLPQIMTSLTILSPKLSL